MSRPTWDEYFLKLAESVATRSPDKKRQVGCVIVDTHRRVVATGFNGTPPGFDDSKVDWWDKETKEHIVIHAEANALLHADGPRIEGGTLYCTYSPCANCAKLIAGAGIKRTVFRETSDALGLDILSRFGVEATRV